MDLVCVSAASISDSPTVFFCPPINQSRIPTVEPTATIIKYPREPQRTLRDELITNSGSLPPLAGNLIEVGIGRALESFDVRQWLAWNVVNPKTPLEHCLRPLKEVCGLESLWLRGIGAEVSG